MPQLDVDYLIIGAGIAGASVGYWLAPHGRVAVVEREAQPGYHSTGRSAAMVLKSYGPPQVRALTAASWEFFRAPPVGFSDGALLRERGALIVASADQRALLAEHWTVARACSPDARVLDATAALKLVPVLRPERVFQAVLEPDAADIDVHALHQGFLRGIRRNGGQVQCGLTIDGIDRTGNDCWTLQAGSARYRTRVLVNAAGAWCDEVARAAGIEPVGLVPKRRSAFTFPAPPGLKVDDWPLCAPIDWSWYMKPEAAMLLGSPANADPVEPQDVQPEQLDIALGIDAIESWTHLQIRRPIRMWAGLRSFVADGELVGGFEPDAAGFFWIAGQGGYGVQTSAAMGEACAALIQGHPIPGTLASFGVCSAALSPRRLRVNSIAGS